MFNLYRIILIIISGILLVKYSSDSGYNQCLHDNQNFPISCEEMEDQCKTEIG